MTVACQIDEPQIRVAPIQLRQRAKWGKRVPTSIGRAFVKAGYGVIQQHKVERAVACQIEELLTTSVLLGEGWFLRNQFCRPEPRGDRFLPILAFDGDWAEVALVEPRAGLLSQDTRRSLAVEI